MQLPQERQPRRGLTIEQHEEDWEVIFLHAAVEGLVVLDYLPRPDALFANEQDEGGGLGDCAGKLGEPQAFGPQALLAQRKSLGPGPCAGALLRGSA
jgi:hypothetical protein